MITCVHCKSDNAEIVHRSPINPAEDRFRCRRCGTKFNRYDYLLDRPEATSMTAHQQHLEAISRIVSRLGHRGEIAADTAAFIVAAAEGLADTRTMLNELARRGIVQVQDLEAGPMVYKLYTMAFVDLKN